MTSIVRRNRKILRLRPVKEAPEKSGAFFYARANVQLATTVAAGCGAANNDGRDDPADKYTLMTMAHDRTITFQLLIFARQLF